MMDRADTLHGRTIFWLKIAMPLMALTLLSTVFLFSRTADTGRSVPLVNNLENRISKQQITAPKYSGVTDRGDIISVMADRAMPSDEGAAADRFSAQIDSISGRKINLGAQSAWLETDASLMHFEDDVYVEESAGYRIHTQALVSSLDKLHVETLAPVTVTGPIGRFYAGHMIIHVPEPDGGVQILFTNGVNLIYEP